MTSQTPSQRRTTRPSRTTSPAAPTPLNPSPYDATLFQGQDNTDGNTHGVGMSNVPQDRKAMMPTGTGQDLRTAVTAAMRQEETTRAIHATSTRFGATPAADVVVVSDPDTIKARDLVGCDIHIIGFDMVLNNFDPQHPKWQAVCTITIDQRPELLMRKVYLSSKLAIAQLKSVPQAMFPIWCSLTFDDPKKGRFASIQLAEPLEDAQWDYIHPTDDEWDEYCERDTPSYRSTRF